MKVSAEKTADKPRITAERRDGVMVQVLSPTKKFSPPHDIIHLVVEKHLAFDSGFWASISDGALFKGMEVVAGRQKPKAAAKSAEIIKANQKQLVRAEVHVGVFQQVLLDNPEDGVDAVRRQLAERGASIDQTAATQVWAELLETRDRWDALALGEAMELDWPDRKR